MGNTNVIGNIFGNSKLGQVLGYTDSEIADYRVVKSSFYYEIREYPEQLRAEIDVTTNEVTTCKGYHELDMYREGENTPRKDVDITAPVAPQRMEKIQMVAPVVTSLNRDQVTMSFILPRKYKTVDELPQPKSQYIRLVKESPHYVAVMKYHGSWSENLARSKYYELCDALRRKKIEILDCSPILYRYNPPWSLKYLRTNEIAVKVRPLLK